MKAIHGNIGPFVERRYFKPNEIEQICTRELRAAGLYPSRPEPVRIDRFIEKRFGISPRNEELPDGVLGFTEFGPNGVRDIVISSLLMRRRGRPVSGASGRPSPMRPVMG